MAAALVKIRRPEVTAWIRGPEIDATVMAFAAVIMERQNIDVVFFWDRPLYRVDIYLCGAPACEHTVAAVGEIRPIGLMLTYSDAPWCRRVGLELCYLWQRMHHRRS
jgi:hypothetical protein